MRLSQFLFSAQKFDWRRELDPLPEIRKVVLRATHRTSMILLPKRDRNLPMRWSVKCWHLARSMQGCLPIYVHTHIHLHVITQLHTKGTQAYTHLHSHTNKSLLHTPVYCYSEETPNNARDANWWLIHTTLNIETIRMSYTLQLKTIFSANKFIYFIIARKLIHI